MITIDRKLTHEEMLERLRRIRSDPGPIIWLPPYAPRCVQCAAKVKPFGEYQIYDHTLGRAQRPYCRRCYRQTNIIERSVQP